MSSRVESFAVTTAALSTTVQPVNFTQDHNELDRVDVVFPNGCANLVTVVLLFSGAIVIPEAAGQVIRGNNRTVSFANLEDMPPGNGWEVSVNNADTVYPHTISVRFFLSDPAGPGEPETDTVLLLPFGGA